MAYDWLSKTMLIERLAGVGVYALLLCVFCLALKNAKDYDKVKRTLNIYLLALCVMAYYYIPLAATDISRWLYFARGWHNSSFSQFLEQHVVNKSTPVAYLYMYFFSFPGYEALLPTFCAFVFYFNVFYIFKDLYKNHNISSRALSIALFFFMSSGCFLEVIGGVRCFVSLSIIARCFYDEFYNNKSIARNLIWEIIASLIHSMALIMFVIRLLFMIFQKNNSFLKKLSALVVITIAVYFLYSHAKDYVDSAIDRANEYISASDDYSYSWEYLIGFLLVCCYILILFYRKSTFSFTDKNVRNFNLLMLAIEIAYCFDYSIFHRSVTFSSILILPAMAKLCNEEEKKSTRVGLIQILSVIILFIACARGNLCAYKFLLFE